MPPDDQIEIAFAGRSNVGKSSVINLLTSQKKLAKTSKTPGRTRSINYFNLAEKTYLIDLPGYGYAKVDHKTQDQWKIFLQKYILERHSLKGIILIMDVRHPFTPTDLLFLDLCVHAQRPCHILLNKSDKLSNNELAKVTSRLSKLEKQKDHAIISSQFFSATSGKGLDELKEKFNHLVSLNTSL